MSGAHSDAPVALPARLVFYDGECGLCHRAVRFLVRLDRERLLRYAPLTGETAERARAALAHFPKSIDTLVFVDHGRVFVRSQAVLRAAAYGSTAFRVLAAIGWLARPVADLMYRVVAQVRRGVFGRADACEVPAPEARHLFLP